jgi:hypothetical protein
MTGRPLGVGGNGRGGGKKIEKVNNKAITKYCNFLTYRMGNLFFSIFKNVAWRETNPPMEKNC